MEPDKKYVISVNTQADGMNKYYIWVNAVAGGDIMPSTLGKVTLYESMYYGSPLSKYPGDNSGIKSEIYGIPDFKFIPD